MDPKEQVRRSLQFSEQISEKIDKKPNELANETLSSKRMKETGKQQTTATRTRRPGPKRSGSDSNASNRTRGH